MPIPGDNGQPVKEREAQEKRIEEVAKHGADVVPDLKKFTTEKTDFGNIK